MYPQSTYTLKLMFDMLPRVVKGNIGYKTLTLRKRVGSVI